MSIQYDEGQIQTISLILDRLEVKGVEQARMLVMLDNVLKKGRRVQKEGVESHGNIDGSELLQPEKETDKSCNNSGKREEQFNQRTGGEQQTSGDHNKTKCSK